MWEEAATLSLAPYAPPEILSADLSGLVLDLAFWGEREPATLRWLDAPPAPAVAEGKALLRALGALDEDGAITPLGRAIRALPLPPRLAAMVTQAAKDGEAGLAAEVAAVLVERGIGGEAADVAARVERLRRDRSQRASDARRLAQGWARMAGGDRAQGAADDAGRMLALAFPDRIARARGKPGEFLMANGRAAALEPHEALARAPYLAVAEIAGRAGAARILAAAALTDEDFAAVAGARIARRDELFFDKASASVRARRVERLGAITLSERTLSAAAKDETPRVLAEGIAGLGIARLAWSKAQLQIRDRVAFLRRAEGEEWPDLSDAALAASAAEWLAPHLTGKTTLAEIGADDLGAALDTLLPWEIKRRLDAEAPTHFEAPTGTRAAVDYEAEAGPTISIRVQELYGLSTHPALAGGRVPLTLELLSPAHRPIQITRDLPGFWKGSWAAVKSEMKGRYPRHLWPDDPASAQATTRAKPRGT
jgi:ATP-dependent helicase HrpB